METTRPTTGIILDLRTKKKDETYPLKLRVTYNRQPRTYGIKIELTDQVEEGVSGNPKKLDNGTEAVNGTKIDSLTADELKRATNSKAKQPYKEIGIKLSAIEKHANKIITELKEFSFEAFSAHFTGMRRASNPGSVLNKYAETIASLEFHDQLGTASSYDLSLKSIKAFIKHDTGHDVDKLFFKDITVNWLQKYEAYMVSDKLIYNLDGSVKVNSDGIQIIKPGLTLTTVGIYLRPLRALFHRAMDCNEVDTGKYPFGSESKNLYEIPIGDNIKKALSTEQLNSLLNATALTPEQEKAKDFWFFSFSCNGMNVKDICLLRNERLQSDRFSFYRAKTRKTKKKQVLITVMLTPFAQSVIDKYRTQDTHPKSFVFPVLTQTDNELEKRKKVQAFTRFINQHIKKVATKVGITSDISTYFARHSFATQVILNGGGMEFVQEAFSHGDIRTTKDYFGGFPDETKKAVLNKLMDNISSESIAKKGLDYGNE